MSGRTEWSEGSQESRKTVVYNFVQQWYNRLTLMEQTITIEFPSTSHRAIAELILSGNLKYAYKEASEKQLEIDVSDRQAVIAMTEKLKANWYVASFRGRWHIEFYGPEKEAKDYFERLAKGTMTIRIILVHSGVVQARKTTDGLVQWRKA